MFAPVASTRLYEQVATQIRQLIATGDVGAGQRLPAEKELARQLGVSRPTIREAMIALEIAGLIEVRTGSGIYVSRPVETKPIILDSGPAPFELLNARLLLEGEIAAEVAIRATAEDLAEIRQAALYMEQVLARGDNYMDADRAFHIRIAAASGNGVLAGLVDTLWSSMFNPMFDKLREHARQTPEAKAKNLRDHRAIVDALSTRDALGARSAMRQHLQHVEAALSGETEGESAKPDAKLELAV